MSWRVSPTCHHKLSPISNLSLYCDNVWASPFSTEVTHLIDPFMSETLDKFLFMTSIFLRYVFLVVHLSAEFLTCQVSFQKNSED